jgi:sirohydrochlorin ferrochelatase
MEQDQFLRWDESLMSASSVGKHSAALLLAAHGERSGGAANNSVTRLAAAVRACGLLQEVAVGFIKGVPSIAQSVVALRARKVIVYPMFLSSGYFTRVRLPQLLEDALGADTTRSVHILPPLGLDLSLGTLIAEKLLATTRCQGLPPQLTNVVLLTHGSTGDPASRNAAEQLARQLRQYLIFRSVGIALLEEPPFLPEAARRTLGPLIVFGLFAGDGMHGAGDAPNLVAALGRDDAVFAGTVTSLPGIAGLISAAVAQLLAAEKPAVRNVDLCESALQAHAARREATVAFS